MKEKFKNKKIEVIITPFATIPIDKDKNYLSFGDYFEKNINLVKNTKNGEYAISNNK